MKVRNLALAAAFMVGLANMTGAALAQTKVFVDGSGLDLDLPVVR